MMFKIQYIYATVQMFGLSKSISSFWKSQSLHLFIIMIKNAVKQ